MVKLWLLCDVDGASSDQEGSSSVGVVIRDSSGQVMATL